MNLTRRAAPAALTVALAAGTAACDSPIPGSAPAVGTAAPSPDPLAGLNGDQIAKQVVADLNDASSVRSAGTITESGQSISMDMTLVHGQGCEGSITLHGKGTVQVIYKGKSVWIRPSEAFYKSEGVSAAMILLLSGKWLNESGKSGSSGLSSTCSLNSLAGFMGEHNAGMTKGPITSLDGQQAVAITQAGQSGAMYVSDTAKPELLRVSASSGPDTGNIAFSDYNRPVTITPPPASKTLNGDGLAPQIGPIML